jgi:hypothetical protein
MTVFRQWTNWRHFFAGLTPLCQQLFGSRANILQVFGSGGFACRCDKFWLLAQILNLGFIKCERQEMRHIEGGIRHGQRCSTEGAQPKTKEKVPCNIQAEPTIGFCSASFRWHRPLLAMRRSWRVSFPGSPSAPFAAAPGRADYSSGFRLFLSCPTLLACSCFFRLESRLRCRISTGDSFSTFCLFIKFLSLVSSPFVIPRIKMAFREALATRANTECAIGDDADSLGCGVPRSAAQRRVSG